MNDLMNIVKKEIREILTPSSVASVVLMMVLFTMLGGIIGSEIESGTTLPVIGIGNFEDQTVDTSMGEWNAYESVRELYIESGVKEQDIDKCIIKLNDENIFEQIEKYGVSCALILSDDFRSNIEAGIPGEIYSYFIYKPSGIMGGLSSELTPMITDYMSTKLSYMIIGSPEYKTEIDFLVTPIDANTVFTYVNGEVHEGITPLVITSAISQQTLIIPMIIMIVIMMIGSVVINSMGSEKENKTLETLLTLPIKRRTLVTGKLVAAAVAGLLFGIAYMIGIGIYMNSMLSIGGPAGVDLSDLGMTLDPLDYVLLMLSMFLSILCALGICMILGAFAKNYKSAQTMAMPLCILAIVPMFITMFAGWYSAGPVIQTVLFAIPFSHPMMATEFLLYNDYMMVFAGLAYMLIFAVVMIAATVKLYNSDILITGLGQNKFVQKLTKSK